MCLLIGPTGVGKTLLLRRLGSYFNIKEQDPPGVIPATISTVGTNLVDVMVNKKQEIVVREIGGVMSPIWPNYFKNCSALIYMVDMSNRLQVAAGCIQLLAVLSDKTLATDRVLILLNKMDLATCISRFEFESLFRMDDIIKHCHQKLTILEVSAHTGQGLSSILDWLANNTSKDHS